MSEIEFRSTRPKRGPVARCAILMSAACFLVALPASAIDKAEATAWVESKGAAYKQEHSLSCEIAAIRLCLGLMGARPPSEETILSTIPRAGDDPEKAFVCDDIDGGRRNKDRSIHWNNYGAHPPVVVAELERRLSAAGLSGRYEIREMKADDAHLRALAEKDPRFLGAVVWVVGHPERWGRHPKVNERGMVLGEHVRFALPALAPDGLFRIWDPETGKVGTCGEAGAGRDRFSYRVLALFAAAR
jgi:hypothetical protein